MDPITCGSRALKNATSAIMSAATLAVTSDATSMSMSVMGEYVTQSVTTFVMFIFVIDNELELG